MYDVIVIGGGPGGYGAAIRASQLKGKVALVEGGTMGGTCVMRGCIPSKIWLRAAATLEQARKAGDFGVEVTVGKVNYESIIARKQGVSSDIRMGMEALLANNGVDVVTGMASISSANSVSVDGQTLEGKSIIIATGSTLDLSSVSSVPGLKDVALTTDDVLDMKAVPASLLITDPSYIGVEMAMLFTILGSQVTYAFPGPRFLPDEDQDTSQRLAQSLRERGVKLMPRHTLASVDKGVCTLKSGDKEQSVTVEKVLVSQRKAATDGLGLDTMSGAKVNVHEGAIVVDAHCRTSCPSIYAIGDCTGGVMLSHVATAMGICAAENSMGTASKYAAHLASRAIWGLPEMGCVGLSEEQAERKGYDVEVGSFPYAINGYAMLRGEVDGAVKIIADSATGEILGGHIVGANASELIGEVVLAMQLECTVGEFAKGFRVHPAFCETVVDAARDAAGWALYLPKKG